ncbi:MAG: membrane dipeptidase [Bacteroidetes bacterium]|nr:membrane dipeptidase [Bacteroidota bacterium]
MNAFVDLHCHPTLKPYGQSFTKKQKGNSSDINDRNSVWYYDPPTVSDKLLNYLATLTRFSQANFQALCYGNVGIICASLYPIEIGFFKNKLPQGAVRREVNNFVTGVGDSRVEQVIKTNDYFTDLEQEYKFLQQLDGQIFTIDSQDYQYKLISSYDDLNSIQAQTDNIFTVCVLLSIEGGHAFGCGIPGKNANKKVVLANVAKVKSWQHRPLFIAIGHHFYNELCGHPKSLTGILGKVCDQSVGMNEGITPLGYEVISLLLDNKNQQRILIDIKHMSILARNQYYQLLRQEYAGQNIPILVSHGGVTGIPSNTSNWFLNESINFDDTDLLEIARSNGLFGIQLDERRIGSEQELKKTRGEISRKKILYNWARLVWRQIQHIAELLDRNNMFAWGIQCIGSDFDGIVNPINGYWTEEEMQFLDDYLLKHAYNFINNPNSLRNDYNILSAEMIVNLVMYENASSFIRKNY